MFHVTIDGISVKELDAICAMSGRNVWEDCGFDSMKDAKEFASWVKGVSPRAVVEVEFE